MLCVFSRKRIFPAVSEQIRRSAERFRTLGRALLTHCVSAVNSRSVSCISAVFGPILELTQEIGPFWQPLPAGTAHSSPGTFCSTLMQAQTCVCLYTQAKKGKKARRIHTQSWFFFFFETFPSFLPVFAYRSDFYFWMNQRWARCWLLCCVTNPRQRRDNSLSTPPVSWRPTAEFRFNSGLFSPPLVYFLVSHTE